MYSCTTELSPPAVVQWSQQHIPGLPNGDAHSDLHVESASFSIELNIDIGLDAAESFER